MIDRIELVTALHEIFGYPDISTRRERIASAVLAGMQSQADDVRRGDWSYRGMAKDAVAAADALIAALDKPAEPKP